MVISTCHKGMVSKGHSKARTKSPPWLPRCLEYIYIYILYMHLGPKFADDDDDDEDR